jgi:hypothetical protein
MVIVDLPAPLNDAVEANPGTSCDGVLNSCMSRIRATRGERVARKALARPTL